jgi:hypothetical protein
MLAIVIPYYKFTFFEETLKSLANQTDKRFKVYIGNDASLENPEILLKEYEGRFDFEYKKFDKNLGSTSLTSQWERCIAMTKGEEWISILGDDDVLSSQVVESFYENYTKINELNIKVIRFASKIIDSSGNALSETYYHPEIELAGNSYYKKFINESRSSLSEYIFSRSSYDAFKFKDYPLGWHSDDTAWLDFSKFGNVFTINEATLSIRSSTENISSKTDNLDLKNHARLLFFKDMITIKNYRFNKTQKKAFLFEFGILLKEQNQLTSFNVMLVFYKFIAMGSFYDGFRFLRRVYRNKFLKK